MCSILITGATGYLGSSLTAFLLKNGYDISVLVRNVVQYNNTEQLADEKIIGLNNNNGDKSFDCILHCATRYKADSLLEIAQANIAFPLQVAQQFLNKDGWFLNIDTSLDPKTNFYSTSKNYIKEILGCIADHEGLKVINLELEYFFDENEPEKRFLKSLIKACIKNDSFNLTPGEQIRDFIHMDDLSNAIGLVIRSLKSFEKNYTNIELGLGEGITIKELALIIKELTNSSSELKFGAIPYRENETMVSQADTQILNDLGWMPKYSLRSALQETIQKLNF